ncbi:hypothetical protein [Pseudomonas migulae]|uniref:Uncharacterized protein n=1 Tax=Pseudomonas migulae TaxID=78543 RepID=A0ABY8MYZ6_9PSED|nr:hypothetical protein [Pseudomonas migulae]WGK91257.1 hypothetical protein MOQ58_03445 [Pseudomonas migulae]
MKNLELYGVEKVGQELRSREAELLLITSNGEKAARTMAWEMFCADQLKIDDNNTNLTRLAQIKYFHAVDLLSQYDLSMDINELRFKDCFLDELWVINKKVTKKGVQIVFYIFVALGLFGLYKMLF